MLFILTITSIGVPLIAHSCSHNDQKDIHIFSSDHHCDDKCGKATETENALGFNESSCCTFETSFLKNENLVSSKNQLTNKQVVILYNLFLAQEYSEKEPIKYLSSKTYFHKRFGYHYRIALQSFLC